MPVSQQIFGKKIEAVKARPYQPMVRTTVLRPSFSIQFLLSIRRVYSVTHMR